MRASVMKIAEITIDRSELLEHGSFQRYTTVNEYEKSQYSFNVSSMSKGIYLSHIWNLAVLAFPVAKTLAHNGVLGVRILAVKSEAINHVSGMGQGMHQLERLFCRQVSQTHG